MKITISGPAAALREDNSEILDPQTLRRFHGVKSEETCVDYLDDPLADVGLIGGHLEFVFDAPAQRLRISTVYHSPRTLKRKELDELVKETRGQWSDGIGEGGFDTGDKSILLDPYPILSSADVDDVRIEQIDDGVKVPKPKKSPLFAAVQKNDIARITQLLDAGEPINPRDRERNTPLLLALWGNECQAEAALLLIKRGADLNVANKYSFTPVQRAAMDGYLEILRALLMAGADPDFAAADGLNSNPPLHLACNRHQAESVKLLVEHGANVNLQCSSGYTAMMHLKPADVAIARYLIEHGADVEATNAFGKGMDQTLKLAIT